MALGIKTEFRRHLVFHRDVGGRCWIFTNKDNRETGGEISVGLQPLDFGGGVRVSIGGVEHVVGRDAADAVRVEGIAS